jgi:hypothetical protein
VWSLRRWDSKVNGTKVAQSNFDAMPTSQTRRQGGRCSNTGLTFRVFFNDADVHSELLQTRVVFVVNAHAHKMLQEL